MIRKIFVNSFIFLFAFLGCFLLGEVAVRTLGSFDADGNFYFQNRLLKPYRLPVHAIKRELEDYFHSDSHILMFDPKSGWRPEPNGASEDGFYRYNSQGIRSAPSEYAISAQEGICRIAIFGDSFTHGSEVRFEDTWGYALEHMLKENGFNVEVLNFGVIGYGMDQAYLLWRELGCQFSPDIVILGFAPVDIKRNLKLVRTILSPSVGIPFTKPRFIQTPDGLKLINAPTPPPEMIPDILENFQSWEYAEYDYFYAPADYDFGLRDHSKLFSLAAHLLAVNRFNVKQKKHEERKSFYALDREPAQLTLAIVQAFAKDVADHGARFLMVYLPQTNGLVAHYRDRKPGYTELLEELDAEFDVIHPESEMVMEGKTSSIEAFFQPGKHYSPKANKIVANLLAKYLIREVFFNTISVAK